MPCACAARDFAGLTLIEVASPGVSFRYQTIRCSLVRFRIRDFDVHLPFMRRFSGTRGGYRASASDNGFECCAHLLVGIGQLPRYFVELHMYSVRFVKLRGQSSRDAHLYGNIFEGLKLVRVPFRLNPLRCWV